MQDKNSEILKITIRSNLVGQVQLTEIKIVKIRRKQNAEKNNDDHAAIYLRLSRDDEDIDGSAKRESDSISSQRELARSL